LAKELKQQHDNEGLTDAEKEERRVILSKRAKHLYVEKLIAVSTPTIEQYYNTDAP
jgi:hypothetical protein